ncbi:MAG: cob(I)yrinic acid a,c-diamide adenosyltransferase [Rhodospirillaceae bacterium]
MSDWTRKREARKVLAEQRAAGHTLEKGLLIVHTGAGKGKTTAALGLILRAAGHGLAVGMVQFVKGGWSPGELAALARFEDLVTVRVLGEGFTWETRDRARDEAAAAAAWAAALAMIAEPRYRLIVLDELTIALRYGFLDIGAVVAALAGRRPDLHIVVTGRNAPAALTEAADLVTEMTAVKHPYQAGIKAQPGIEF